MQTLKDDTRAAILRSAREHFLLKGVKAASIRGIADEAGVSVGNLYKYFRSKEELYCAVLHPVLTELERLMRSHNDESYLSLSIFTREGASRTYMQEMMRLIRMYRPELRLLLFQSEGTSLEHYTDRITEAQAAIGREYLRIMKERYPAIEDNISPFLIHITASTWTAIFVELVAHDEYSDEEVSLALDQYVRYGVAGWRELLRPFEKR